MFSTPSNTSLNRKKMHYLAYNIQFVLFVKLKKIARKFLKKEKRKEKFNNFDIIKFFPLLYTRYVEH